MSVALTIFNLIKKNDIPSLKDTFSKNHIDINGFYLPPNPEDHKEKQLTRQQTLGSIPFAVFQKNSLPITFLYFAIKTSETTEAGKQNLALMVKTLVDLGADPNEGVVFQKLFPHAIAPVYEALKQRITKVTEVTIAILPIALLGIIHSYIFIPTDFIEPPTQK